jgi:hypothetical protein
MNDKEYWLMGNSINEWMMNEWRKEGGQYAW